MMRSLALGLVSMVLIASPSAANASLLLTGPVYYSAYAEDDPIYDVQDVLTASFPAANSYTASIDGASGRHVFSQTQSGYLTEFLSSCFGEVSGFAITNDRSRYGTGFFINGFTVTNTSTYSYSMSASTTGSADNLVSNFWLFDADTGLDEFLVFSTASGNGTLQAGHQYFLLGTVYAENFSELNAGAGGTGSVSADFEFQVVSTPEPSSIALLGLGIMGLGGYSWRRRKIGAPA